jgi:hypothetical protein
MRPRKNSALPHDFAGLGSFGGRLPQADPWQRRPTWRPRNYHLPYLEHDVALDDVTVALVHVIVRAPHTRSREALVDALYQWRRQTPERFCGVV